MSNKNEQSQIDIWDQYKDKMPDYIQSEIDFDLYKRRHSAEHVLTQAMQSLYGTDKFHMAIGPATAEGFYFDFEPLDGLEVKESDFEKIENEMRRIINEGQQFIKKEVNVKEAKALYPGNPYKEELIDELAEKGEVLTAYENVNAEGEITFADLCMGPHKDSTKEIGVVKLLSIAGAYWRGDENNKMLTRIYGTAFSHKKELKQYLFMLEEAKKRDHRKLGKEHELFFISDMVGGGLNLWAPKGAVLRRELDRLVWELRRKRGYQQVDIPHITKRDLYEASGHWDKFSDELYKIQTREGDEFALKPMNCPHHTRIYDLRKRSYRELPQRYTETTKVYRDEQSGEVSGLSRVRAITQDDAHVFCRHNQIADEFNKVWDIIEEFYGVFGIKLRMRLSFHDPENMDSYLGTSEVWEKMESQLEQMAKDRGVDYFIAKGEAAMYGPKTDFMGRDSLGREHQVATVQLDMNMPERFDLSCINEKGEEERIAMIHAAIMGSIERFSSVMVEHFAAKFPTWLAPEQIRILPISDDQIEYCNELRDKIVAAGDYRGFEFRVAVDDRSERLQSKIRDAAKDHVPYTIIIGDKEIEENKVSPRVLGVKKNLGGIDQAEFIEKFLAEVENRDLVSFLNPEDKADTK